MEESTKERKLQGGKDEEAGNKGITMKPSLYYSPESKANDLGSGHLIKEQSL